MHRQGKARLCTIAHMGTDSEIHFMSPHTLPMTEKGVVLQISTSFQLLGIGEVSQEAVTMVLTVKSWYVENHTFLMPEPAEKHHFILTMTVLEFPPRESCRRRVRLEVR